MYNSSKGMFLSKSIINKKDIYFLKKMATPLNNYSYAN